MAVAKKKSTSSSFIGYGTNVKRGKAIAKTTAAKVRNRVTAAGGPDAARVNSSKLKKIVEDPRLKLKKIVEDERLVKNIKARKQARSMNKKRG